VAGKPNCPRTMDRVYRAEVAVVARREEPTALEQQMNDEDAAWQDSLSLPSPVGPARPASLRTSACWTWKMR
jgi:hypothetical protein